MKRGALDLLDRYHGSQSDVAEAYIRGDLPEHLASFVWDVVSNTQICDARERLHRTSWRLEERVAKLEEEVGALQRKEQPHVTLSPYQPRSLPGR